MPVSSDFLIAREYAQAAGMGIHEIVRKTPSMQRNQTRYHVCDKTRDPESFREEVVATLGRYMKDYSLVSYRFITLP